jgi:transcription-repair coupling factor (superfamily II helicase)
MKERIRDMADRADPHRRRADAEARRRVLMEPPEGLYDEFCARFPFAETEDQLRAIEDVLADLAAGRPMDRLVCGDVGFGKTEVALRAAFVAAMAGGRWRWWCRPRCWRASTSAPSRERFAGCRCASRSCRAWSPPRRRRRPRRASPTAAIDIVVGTHALLAKGDRVPRPRPADRRRGAAFRRRPTRSA